MRRNRTRNTKRIVDKEEDNKKKNQETKSRKSWKKVGIEHK